MKTDSLVDNRDYSVNEVCDARHQEIATLQATTSYSHDTLYVNMRQFMLSSLLRLQDATTSKDTDTLDNLVSQFQSDVIEKADKLPVLEVCIFGSVTVPLPHHWARLEIDHIWFWLNRL